jgi:hypothetical protein
MTAQHSYQLVSIASHYHSTVAEMRAQITALRALPDNAYAQAQADALDGVIRHLSLLGKAIEGVPTWQDINDSLRAGA